MDYKATLGVAQRRRRALLSELDKLDALIAATSALVGEGQSSGGAASKAPRSVPLEELTQRQIDLHDPRLPAAARSARDAPKLNAAIRVATEVLIQSRKPITTRDMLPLLQERGVEVAGKKPIGTLSAMLNNAKQFKNHKNIGWWFVDEPVPTSDAQTSFDEAAGHPAKEDPAASNPNQERTQDAPAIVEQE